MVPKLIKLRNNLTVALFELMKLVPANYVIMQALAQGKINPKYPIVETSSGTYALGLGIVCAELKLPFIIISDSVIDKTLEARLYALGGKVQFVSCTSDQFDVQTVRLECLREYLANKYFGLLSMIIQKIGQHIILLRNSY
jgi:cysteine synthase A